MFVEFKESDKKKLKAIFYNNDMKKIKTVHFGSKGMKDYTLHSPKDREARKESYLKRHHPREDWNNPMTAGALAKFILWNKTTRKASIKDFIKRFNLKLKS